MNQILRCDWLPEWVRWRYLADSILHAVSAKKNLFFIPSSEILYFQACSAKMAGYWPRSFSAGL